jgi:hypothetical protein
MGLREWGDKFSSIFIGSERAFLSEFFVSIGPRWQFFTDVAAFQFADVPAICSQSLFRECEVISSSLIWKASIYDSLFAIQSA